LELGEREKERGGKAVMSTVRALIVLISGGVGHLFFVFQPHDTFTTKVRTNPSSTKKRSVRRSQSCSNYTSHGISRYGEYGWRT